MTAVWAGKWRGGRFRRDPDTGDPIFIIEKMRGERYTITLSVRTEQQAEAELALFLRDPAGYDQRSKETGLLPDAEAVVITKEEVSAFAKYLTEEKHRAPSYITATKTYLTAWANALRGRDLRKISVAELYKHLGTWETARNLRVAALRTFCSYLVRRQRLTLAENRAALLEITKPPPARLLKRRGYSIEQVQDFYAALEEQRVRDMFCLGAKGGMHGTEIGRIARGEVEITKVEQKGIAAVLRFIHKSRYDHSQSVDAQCLAAVQRLMAVGNTPSTSVIKTWVDKAAASLEKPPVHHHWLRHSFFTWGRKVGRMVRLEDGGLTLQEMAAAVGHRSLLMGKDHYDNTEVPPMVVLPIILKHPEDPPL